MNNQTFENVFSFFNEVVETLDTKEETNAIKKTQLAIQELEKLREKQKADSKNTLKVLLKKLETTKENTNHTQQELEELRQSGLLSNLEKENNQLDKENSELEQELQNEYDELVIEEKKLDLKEKREDNLALDPSLLKIGIYRELGIEAVADNNGNITKCHIHNSNTNNNHTIFFPNNQNYIQQTQQSISYATTNLLWNLCTSNDDNEFINIDLTRGINNNISNIQI